MVNVIAFAVSVLALVVASPAAAVPSLPGSLLDFRGAQSPVLGLRLRYDSVGASSSADLAGFHARQRSRGDAGDGNSSLTTAASAADMDAVRRKGGGAIHGGSLPFGAALELSFEAFGRCVVGWGGRRARKITKRN